jgi:hypothetical protein
MTQQVRLEWNTVLPNIDLLWRELSVNGGATFPFRITAQLDPRSAFFYGWCRICQQPQQFLIFGSGVKVVTREATDPKLNSPEHHASVQEAYTNALWSEQPRSRHNRPSFKLRRNGFAVAASLQKPGSFHVSCKTIWPNTSQFRLSLLCLEARLCLRLA